MMYLIYHKHTEPLRENLSDRASAAAAAAAAAASCGTFKTTGNTKIYRSNNDVSDLQVRKSELQKEARVPEL